MKDHHAMLLIILLVVTSTAGIVYLTGYQVDKAIESQQQIRGCFVVTSAEQMDKIRGPVDNGLSYLTGLCKDERYMTPKELEAWAREQ